MPVAPERPEVHQCVSVEATWIVFSEGYG